MNQSPEGLYLSAACPGLSKAPCLWVYRPAGTLPAPEGMIFSLHRQGTRENPEVQNSESLTDRSPPHPGPYQGCHLLLLYPAHKGKAGTDALEPVSPTSGNISLQMSHIRYLNRRYLGLSVQPLGL